MYADREEEALERQRRRLQNGGSVSDSRRSRRASLSRSPPPSSISRASSRRSSLSPSPPPPPGSRGHHSSRLHGSRIDRYRSSADRDRDFDDHVSRKRSRDEDDGDEINRGHGPRASCDSESRERELQEQLRRRAMMSKGSRLATDARPARSPSRSPRLASRTVSRSRSPDAERRRRERRERRQGREVRADTFSQKKRASDYGGDAAEDDHALRASRRRQRRGYDDNDGNHSRRDDSEDGSEPLDRRDSRQRRSSAQDDLDFLRSSSIRRSERQSDSLRDGAGYYRAPPPPHRYYDRYGPPAHDPYYARPPPRRYQRSTSPQVAAASRRRRGESRPRSPDFDDYEMRSIFCSQLAARLSQRDLGEFFEDKLGAETVMDVKIVIDRITGRSKGVGYVELKNEELVEQALDLTGTPLFGIPIVVQKTDAARNKAAASSTAELARPNLPAAPILSADQAAKLPKLDGNPIHIDPANVPSAAARLYVGNLHFDLTEVEVKAVFEPFGTILSVDLHREPGTLKSKGFAFVQFINSDIAEKAIEHMNGFELMGRQIKVGHVNSARVNGFHIGNNSSNTTSSNAPDSSGNAAGAKAGAAALEDSGASATLTSAFDEGGGGGLTASSRAALMEKLARVDQQATGSTMAAAAAPTEQHRPSTIPQATSKGILLKNMFNPEEETERGWDQELGEDIKDECEAKYGKVDAIKVDVNSLGEVWVRFAQVDGAQKAVQGLNGRFFGGRSISAVFVSEGILASMLG